MILYICTTVLSICSLSLSAAIIHGMLLLPPLHPSLISLLSDYDDSYSRDERSFHNTSTHDNDIIGIASYNIVVAVASITVFTCAFFLDAIWPERRESNVVKTGWKICVVLASMMALADGLAFTVIVATGKAYIEGVAQTDVTESNSPGFGE